MIELMPYTSEKKKEWDDMVRRSKVDTFLFLRNFMDYHSDRFMDSSFFVLKKGKIEGVIPGNIKDDIFYSHQGLTYGGLVLSGKIKTKDVISIFDRLNDQLREYGIKKVVYKPPPYIYYSLPGQEDLYALFLLKAIKVACNISSTICSSNKVPFQELRKRGIRKARTNGLSIKETDDLLMFWGILEENLLKNYGKTPVHNASEILQLKKLFPDSIKLHVVYQESKPLAGCLLFVMRQTVHVQYIAASNRGKQYGALDLLFSELIDKTYSNKTFFDFGHSTENNGWLLNEGLLFQKEGFGARGVVYETYEYSI